MPFARLGEPLRDIAHHRDFEAVQNPDPTEAQHPQFFRRVRSSARLRRSDGWAALFPNSTLIEVPDARTFVSLDKPEAVIDAVAAVGATEPRT